MKCMDERGQIVLPVFYHVDPSDVRKQKGKYKEAFAKHDQLENYNRNKVESWRKSLVDAGNLSGWVLANGYESKLTKEIVDTISKRLYSLKPSSANEHLVGIDTRLNNLKMKLELGGSTGGVLMIGIWGVGGSGKSSKDGLEKLQQKILSSVSKRKVETINRVEDGKHMIKSNLYHRKVLIVLDDVNDRDQLDALVGSHDWFGEGSRIIITTRDENLLNSHKVNMIHHTSLLDDEEAIELFCSHAPREYRNIEDYDVLSKGVVSYARGLPLALKFLVVFFVTRI
ncbi:hypothetical protein R6Q59_030366 [Mikania micrantha]